jgi:hypothetical protein
LLLEKVVQQINCFGVVVGLHRKTSQGNDAIFRARFDPKELFVDFGSLVGVVVDPIELSQHEVPLTPCWIDADNFFELVDCLVQRLLERGGCYLLPAVLQSLDCGDVDVSEQSMRSQVIGIQFDRFLGRLGGFLTIPLVEIGPRHRGVDLCIVWSYFKGLPILLDGVVERLLLI